ncbi:MAG: DUF1778 domain-containing protein [Chloroflexota bacterium]|nr:DUF1778 domain-containing protein [Chloroflexota bacterium]
MSETRPARATKDRRNAVRLTDEVGARLDEAVALSGRNRTELITEAIADKADAVIRTERFLKLSERDMDALLAALDYPPPPDDAMLRSVTRWRERGAPS